MTTKAMYDKGLRCRGKGFCDSCKNKTDCVEYVSTDVEPKPPLGIMPKYIWDSQRIEYLKGAIDKYCNANLEVPCEWIEEYNTLIKLYKKEE